MKVMFAAVAYCLAAFLLLRVAQAQGPDAPYLGVRGVDQSQFNGDYKMTGQIWFGRPVFQNSQGIYLFSFRGHTWVIQAPPPSDEWNAHRGASQDAWNPANAGWTDGVTVEWVGDDPSAKWKADWFAEATRELLDSWTLEVKSADYIPQRVGSCDPDALSPVAAAMATALPPGKRQVDPSVAFADETFTYIYRPENANVTGSVETDGLYNDFLWLDGRRGPHQLYDDGTHGDAVAGDGVFSRSCLSFNQDHLGNGLFRDFFGTIVLSTSLRGMVEFTQVHPHVRMNDTGYFINLGETYGDRWNKLWDLISPETSLACAAAWDLAGDVFDFFIIQDRDSTGGAGYIRVHDNILNTGFEPPCEPRSYCYNIIDGKEHRELIGIVDTHWLVLSAITHELGHGLLGMAANDFPAPGIGAWNSGDGQHLDSDTTVTGLLAGPFWDPDRGWPFPVLTPNREEVYLTTDGRGGFTIKPIDEQHAVWADIFLYMMGLLPHEEVTETYYKLVNPHIARCESLEFGLVCSGTRVSADEVIPFTIDDFMAQFGVREPSYEESQKSWNVGVLNISDRPHTEAEMTWLTLSYREYATATSSDNLDFIVDTPWLVATRGLGSVVIDPNLMTLRELAEPVVPNTTVPGNGTTEGDNNGVPGSPSVESFEGDVALNQSPWGTEGDSGWFITGEEANSGMRSVRSGLLEDSETSSLILSDHFSGSIAFAVRVSSEENFDTLTFAVDGDEIAAWSGDSAWVNFSHPLEGFHTLEWKYQKDSSVSEGEDCAYLDDIRY